MPNIERIRDLREERPKNEEELTQWQERFLKDQRPPAARVVAFSTHRSTIKQTDAAYRQAAPGVNRTPIRVLTEGRSNGPDGDGDQGDEVREFLMTPLKAALVADHIPTEAKIFPAMETPADTTNAAPLPTTSQFGRDVISRPISSTKSPTPASSTAPARSDKPGKKKSLFAQRREQQSNQHPSRDPMPAMSGVTPKAPLSTFSQDLATALDKPSIDTMDHTQMHAQNMHTLAAMSADEIYEAQAEIHKMLSSDTLDYLLQKNTKPSEPTSTSTAAPLTLPLASTIPPPATTNASEEAPPDASHSAPPDDGVTFFNHLKTEYFSNVPTEHEKMEWMGVPNPGHRQTTDEPATALPTATATVSSHASNDLPASPPQPVPRTITSPVAQVPDSQWRFDFRGLVVPPKSDLPVHLGLHHHGHDPEEAGYTLIELLHLTQSAFPAQRVIPLRTLGRILARCREAIFNSPEVPALDHNENTQQAAIPEDESAPKEDPLPRHRPYTTDMAAELLQRLKEAQFPQCLMNILSGSHRTSVLSTLDTIALWLVTTPSGAISNPNSTTTDPPPTRPSAEDRLAPRAVYQTFAEWGLVPRLVELLGPESPVVLAPLSRIQALTTLETMLRHCPDGQSHMTSSADALQRLLQPLVSGPPSVVQGKCVDTTVARQTSLVAQRLLDIIQELKSAPSPPE
ncbi:hypothetical protein H4R34_004168 [Dimargaris verticillata]|uniref:Uncharacterized protein n=1 Tax=Dimargaris verticillata TaxID=2761393 RepID=A0A9W8B5G5_9FUNG|nr:hypothetical protein H4R34_004168 [Dimargaris verticillata]